MMHTYLPPTYKSPNSNETHATYRVGYYAPKTRQACNGSVIASYYEWVTLAEFDTHEQALRRVNYLNGGTGHGIL